MVSKNILAEKTLAFAIRIVKLYKYLTEEKREFIMSKQLLRCGTNPGAMVSEAENAESGMDFIHKLAIAQKEIAETEYWLKLLQATDYLTLIEYQSMDNDAKEIKRMLKSSILTRKKNLAKK
jgi:four helix bundle protein